jgi:hypothetical protein
MTLQVSDIPENILSPCHVPAIRPLWSYQLLQYKGEFEASTLPTFSIRLSFHSNGPQHPKNPLVQALVVPRLETPFEIRILQSENDSD